MKTALAGTLLLCLIAIGSDGAWLGRNVKTDCATSVWSDWKCAGSTCVRKRTVVRKAQNGGAPCPSLVEERSSTAKADPWDQKTVTPRVQSKVVAGTKRYITLAGKTAKVSAKDIITHTKVILPRDIMFLIDMSGSISRSDFQKTKRKLAELVELICGTVGRGKQNNRIAIISFSTNVKLNFDFKTHFDLKAVKKAIMRIPQERRGTCTGDAFKYAHDVMFNPSRGIRSATESVKEVNVLTDGRSNCGADLALNVKKLQVKAFVFAMAIGRFSRKGQKEIESMVSRPLIDHIFSLANFKKFADMVDALKTYPDNCVPFELS